MVNNFRHRSRCMTGGHISESDIGLGFFLSVLVTHITSMITECVKWPMRSNQVCRVQVNRNVLLHRKA